MSQNKRGGICYLKLDGEVKDAKGEFTYNLGRPKRTAIVGTNGETQGYKEEGQTPFIEGVITDADDLDVAKLLTLKDSTVTLELNNGKTIVLKEAFYAGDGNVKTAEGEIEVRFEGKEADEI
jgi:hypothetical protein